MPPILVKFTQTNLDCNASSIHKPRDISRRRLIFPRPRTKGSPRAYLPSTRYIYFYRCEFLRRGGYVFRDHLLLSRPTIPRKASVAMYTHRGDSSSRALSPPSDTCARSEALPFLSTATERPLFVRGPRNLELSPDEDDARVCVADAYVRNRRARYNTKISGGSVEASEKESETLLARKRVASDSLIVAGSLGMIRSHATIFRLPSFPKQKQKLGRPSRLIVSILGEVIPMVAHGNNCTLLSSHQPEQPPRRKRIFSYV